MHHTMRQFNMWLKYITDGDAGFIAWKRIGDYTEMKRMKAGDIITLDIVLSKSKKETAIMRLFNQGTRLVDDEIQLGLNQEYQLYIYMYGKDNEITIKDFQSISID